MKRIAAIILMLVLAACALAGCKSNQASKPLDADSVAQADFQTRTITDSAGRTVAIPASIEKIVALGNTPRMITYLGLAEQAVGISGMPAGQITPVTAYAYANQDLWVNIPLVGTDAAGATDYYPEEIIAVDPDVILCSYTKELGDEIQTKTGIPVIVVPMGTVFGKDYEDALRLLGDVCSVPDRAEEVVCYINDCLQDLETRASAMPAADNPTVLGAAATFKGAHGIEGVYTRYAVLEVIAANDVAAGLAAQAGAVVIDKEQILGWNPQYIFLDSSGVNLVQTDYQKNPDFYAHLAAVQEGNVYQYPSSTSYYANVEISLVNSYYVASILYPEQFQDIDFKAKANEIFKFFLGADDYLSKLEAGGAGYGRVAVGDN